MEELDGRMEELDGRIEALDGRVEALDGRVEALDGRVEALDGRVEALDGRIEALNGRVDGLDGSVTGLRLVIENEIRPNIQILAEGHMMLNEKLDRLLEGEKEREELKIRVDALETGFRLMQDQIIKSA